MVTLLTVGHGTAPATELTDLLSSAGVALVADIRTVPHSRHNPQFDQVAMEEWLPAAGIGYRWVKDLGGFRRPEAGSPNAALRNDAFRGYADYMRTPPFWAALDGVLDAAATEQVAVMCAESVWWRCHRRLVADAAVLARQVDVQHLLHDGRLQVHRPTEGVRLGDDGLLVYDGGQPKLI